MIDDTTQPVGALPEPQSLITDADVGHRAYTANQMHAHALGYHIEQMRLQGFADGAVSLWAYNRRGEALHESRAETAAMMAERDAAREQLSELHRLAKEAIAAGRDCNRQLADAGANMTALEAERAALRRELETAFDYLREALEFQSAPQGPSIHDFGRWRRFVDLSQFRARPIPPDARELLTPERVNEIWQECSDPDRADMSIQQFAEAIQRAAREPDCMDGDGHVYAAASKAHASPELNAAVEASIERAATFAREGREPLTPKRAVDLLAAALRLATVMPGDTADVLYHFKQQLGPAGTSADGGTQP